MELSQSSAPGRPGLRPPEPPAARRVRLVLAGLLAAGLSLAAGLEAQEVPRFRLHEERAREFFRKGLVFYNRQQYVAAREFFYKALDVQPYFHLSRRYLGDAYYYSGDWNAALEQWEFLDSVSETAYPLVRQRSNLLRFYLNQYRSPGELSLVQSFSGASWEGVALKSPVAAALDAENRLYICAFGSANILRITPGGRVEREIRGPIYDRLQGPIAMTLQNNLIYVADFTADRVRVFDANGAARFDFGGPGAAPGRFHGPTGIAVADGAIYVSDSGNRRVQKFDASGKYLLEFREDEDGRALVHPAGLAADADGSVYVADRDDRRIVRFDSDGNFLEAIVSAKLERPRSLNLSGDTLVVADEKNGALFLNLSDRVWTDLPELREASDVALAFQRVFGATLDGQGGLLISDFAAGRVFQLAPQGMRITNLDARIERVDANSFPQMGVFFTLKNRLGAPIRGLDRTDLALYENDRRIYAIRSDNITPYNRRILAVLVKENSPFFRDNFAGHLSSALAPLFDPLRISDRVTLIRAGEQTRRIYDGLERLRMIQLLQTGDVSDAPNLGKGLYEGIGLLASQIGPRSVTLVVSGRSLPDAFAQYSAQQTQQYARAHGILINVISYEGEEDPERRAETMELYRGLARETGGRYYRAYDESALAGLHGFLRSQTDERYLITYRSGLDASLAGRYVDLRMEATYQGVAGIADAGYFIPEANQ